MTATLSQAQQYARLKRTRVIAHRIDTPNDTIIFVLESGQKLTFTSAEIGNEIAELEKAIAREQAHLAIDAGEEPTPKAEKLKKPKAEKPAA